MDDINPKFPRLSKVGRRRLAAPSPAMLRVLEVARDLDSDGDGEVPSVRLIAGVLGISRSYVCRVRRRLRGWGLWEWPDARRGRTMQTPTPALIRRRADREKAGRPAGCVGRAAR